MKERWNHLDKYRQQSPPFHSPPGSTFGSFSVPRNGVILNIIATDGRMDAGGELPDTEWEHVSVHAVDTVFHKRRIPTWLEMCFVKDLFWEQDEVVMQLHVASKDHININEHVLHLWKPTKSFIPLPPKICV